MTKVQFSNRQLFNMIVPLFFEQLLIMLVGIADTFFISHAGEAAVAGVSLVNQFNTIFIYLYTALASGGAVVISQYIGNKSAALASESASQLLMFSTLFSIVVMIGILAGNRMLLHLLFGNVEENVMDACVTYLRISAYSYPAIAIYNTGAAIYRSLGKTSVTMYISVISNVINIIGNTIGIFVLHAGVAGVAYPSLIARAFAALAITVLCFRKSNEVFYSEKEIFSWNAQLLKRILGVAVPNGAENGIFQLVKVALSSIVALFGTYQIAANGVAQSIWSLAALAGAAFGPVYITVIGQCMGAADTEAADYYFKKLIRITLLFSIIWNAVVFLITPLLMRFYSLSEETVKLVLTLVLLHNIFNAFIFPFSGCLGNGLRATGDVSFTMIVSIASTICVRLVLSYLFGVVWNMGVIGIAWAMCADWFVRAILFILRLKSGVWKKKRII
ncbi:MAG: MATE family efflux transporter [Lachnospiraceae bacterium]|nr:MATE family efflux transporter [Lachnospiraceae bacterium]